MNNPVLEEAFYANRNLYFRRINAVKNLKIPMWSKKLRNPGIEPIPDSGDSVLRQIAAEDGQIAFQLIVFE